MMQLVTLVSKGDQTCIDFLMLAHTKENERDFNNVSTCFEWALGKILVAHINMAFSFQSMNWPTGNDTIHDMPVTL